LRTREDHMDYISYLIKKYKLFYVEDPLQEEDFSGFSVLMKQVGKALIVGDDLTVTGAGRLSKAAARESINAMIVKPNQNGYIFDVFKVVQFCKEKKIKTIVSHRSGETMDNALGDYAVGFQADFIKAGIYGKERLVKLRRVIEIEKKILFN